MSKEVMKLALEALEAERDNYQDWDEKDGAPEYIYEAITALREALAEQPAQCAPAEDGVCESLNCPNHKQAQQEPETKDVVIANMGDPFIVKAYVTPQPAQQQEPVAAAYFENITGRIVPPDDTHRRKFPMCYRSLVFGETSPPAQRKPLTDEEKRELIKKSELWDMHVHIGWYSAPSKSFVEKAILLIADIEAAHGIKENT